MKENVFFFLLQINVIDEFEVAKNYNFKHIYLKVMKVIHNIHNYLLFLNYI